MPAYLHKPVSPRWQPGKAPPGTRGYWLLGEGAGGTARDSAGCNHGVLVGSPAWQRGLYGSQLGGFTASDYVSLDNSVSIFSSGPPFWIAVQFSGLGTSSTLACPISLENTGSNREVILYLNNGTPGQIAAFVKNDAGFSVNPIANGTSINNGNPHVLMFASFSGTDHRLFLDGQLVASASSSMVGPVTMDRMSIGVRRKTVVDAPFPGSIIWTGAGNGSVPNPLALAQDLISGQFAAVRPRFSLAVLAATQGGSPSASPLPLSPLVASWDWEYIG